MVVAGESITAEITPVEGSMVATEVVALDHVPPVVVLDHVAELPCQIGVVPVIVCGVSAVMVTSLVAVFTQPLTVTL